MAEKHGYEAVQGYGYNYGNQPTKRARVDSSDSNNRYGGGDPHFAEPSRVVHVRGVADEAREQDLMQCLSQYGNISCITMMPKIRQALVEFEEIACANTLVNQTQMGNPVILCGRPAYANYSKSKQISRNVHVRSETQPNKILLITIINPQYVVTTDILHTIFSKQGMVQRIVIFRKSGLQAMVEFDCVEAARHAKETLNGADIYTGCNTLKIEYSRAQQLNVRKNDSETYDYTQDKGPGMLGHPPPKQGLLSPPPPAYGGGPPAYGGAPNYGGAPPMGYGAQPMQAPQMQTYRNHPSGGNVIMVYGLDKDKMNCDRLFNLLCCYGNVIKIKFLLGKPGTAMAELHEHVACNTVMENLSKMTLFDQQLEFSFSKQDYLVEPANVPNLPDGSPSFKSFDNSKNNRFTSATASSKNRVFTPMKVLHFFNAPVDCTEEQIREMCQVCGVAPPKTIKMFSPSGNARTSSGLIEWESVTQALEALVMCNHYVIRNSTAKTIFTVKLAFSSTPTAS
ncbi:heterogeneous nuclear ribonucleoprotein L [Nematostella vectensis]|uniref:heterogeneous nuclear ribonucleoprotein L n=1 Tax=Nematostella vectensis TaxID=45351 RepID=UPI002077224E|nr:heterogeneous nuclear ribonucleoprotein L [Nematostella vectensis]